MKSRRIKRHRITIQKQVVETGASGAKKVTGWTDVRNLRDIPADFVIVSGGEKFRGNQVQAEVVGVFAIRIQPISILTSYRVVHTNGQKKPYGISLVRNCEGEYESADRETLIFVKAIADG